ncbi:hypothetical protein BVX94_02540 [bacterium B17]|nr:hypothetical protein BVX94_02540 [bacterium B17]
MTEEAQSVLLVDDEDMIRTLFETILHNSLPECKVGAAANGKEAVEAFKEFQYRVILMDLHMPIMTGEQAFKEIESYCKETDQEMPSVIFCTGFAPPDTVQDIIAKSQTHCLLSKPVTGDVIVEQIKSRLQAAG